MPEPRAALVIGAGDATGVADLLQPRLELVGVATRDAGDEAFAREAARDRAAGGLAGADDEGSLVHAQ